MIDDEARQRAILRFMSTSKESSVELAAIQQSVCPDAEIIEIANQVELAIGKGFLVVTPNSRTGKNILLLLDGSGGYMFRPLVTSAGREFIRNRMSRRLLENAPNFLALAKLGKIAVWLTLIVAAFIIGLLSR